jgi:hypothetical protein
VRGSAASLADRLGFALAGNGDLLASLKLSAAAGLVGNDKLPGVPRGLEEVSGHVVSPVVYGETVATHRYTVNGFCIEKRYVPGKKSPD